METRYDAFMSSAPYILHYAPDNASLVIRLALEELRLPYETRLVDRRRQAQRAPVYLALNPSGLIPVLETPDGPIFETAAILLWLADRHGDLGPAPSSPERGDFLKWLFFLSNTLHPALRILFYTPTFIGDDARHQDQLTAVTRDRVLNYLDLLDIRWQHPVPRALSLYLMPMLRWLALYPTTRDTGWFELSRWPALQSAATLEDARPATRAARQAEGLGPAPFTVPRLPDPPEGSAT